MDPFAVGACEAGVCVDPCDPDSVQELPCPVEHHEDMVCCPGVQGCQWSC
jgi:hypothetical protein